MVETVPESRRRGKIGVRVGLLDRHFLDGMRRGLYSEGREHQPAADLRRQAEACSQRPAQRLTILPARLIHRVVLSLELAWIAPSTASHCVWVTG